MLRKNNMKYPQVVLNTISYIGLGIVLAFCIAVGPLMLRNFWEPQYIPLLIIFVFIGVAFIGTCAFPLAIILREDSITKIGIPFITTVKRDEIRTLFLCGETEETGDVFFIPKRKWRKWEKIGFPALSISENTWTREWILYTSGELVYQYPFRVYAVGMVLPRFSFKKTLGKEIFEVLRVDKEDKIGEEPQTQPKDEIQSEGGVRTEHD